MGKLLTRASDFLFKNQTLRQTAAKNTIWLGISNVGGRLLKAAIIIYAARLLGAAGLGVFSYAVTLAGFLSILIDMGVNQILTKSIAASNDQKERIQFISTAFFMKIGLLAVGTALIILVGPHLTSLEEAQALMPIVAIIFIFDALREFGFAFIKAIEKMEYEAGLYIFTNLAVVTFGFFFLFLSPTPRALALSYAIGTGLGATATFFTLRHHFRQLFTGFTKKLIKPILTLAWPFAISGLLGGLMLNTDILMLGWYTSAEDVGLYSAAQRIIQILYILPAILAASILPIFARLAAGDKEKFRRVFERVASIILLAAIPIAVGGAILNKEIITLIFGFPFLAAAIPFALLSLTILADYPSVILSNAIFSYNKHRKLVVFAAIGGFGNVVLNFLLIPRYGIIGCAIATLITQIISNAYLWGQMKKINPFSVHKGLIRMTGATLIMSLVVYILNTAGLPLIGTVIIGIITYFSTLTILREPILKEIRSVFRSSA
ncbi:MAG: hypothetical protein COU11_00625 [Candidatus Harrisonbacteria bacterium CG10_big_fil_rev_8_21_14_0_10_49_15]|uniref:Uncharacterized protein n=1 Tax=Candidatus Harrisonbacteria bacterium CG10_big_fil_rev_8_21_14_0_10_49_15 TaxID=1974587 RepID=A0A2H0UM07_9BACT|nr:MAG: hypothetical protein COU11_00625 [Candidatus Harrisonbacteria bacterium CG10_big_fil_rev_8_21_14_0_10_49_15]